MRKDPANHKVIPLTYVNPRAASTLKDKQGEPVIPALPLYKKELTYEDNGGVRKTIVPLSPVDPSARKSKALQKDEDDEPRAKPLKKHIFEKPTEKVIEKPLEKVIEDDGKVKKSIVPLVKIDPSDEKEKKKEEEKKEEEKKEEEKKDEDKKDEDKPKDDKKP